jgi:hypothetical protein
VRTIKEIQDELDQAAARLAALRRELHEAKCEAANIHIGDIVRTTGWAAKLGEIKVTRIDTSWQSKPWLNGVARKKNGEWGTQVRQVFSDWEHLDG